MYALLVTAVWLLDRWSKVLVARNLPLWSSRPLFGGWLKLTYVQNTGAAFGLFRNQAWLLALVSVILLLSLLFFRRHISAFGAGGRSGIALVLGGALGNLYDRVVFGYVIDFLELPYWPVFNLADSAVVLGVSLLAISIWKWDGREQSGAGSSTDC